MDEKRKPISQKIRFEVFKRDKFTCQYCGRKSPDVILEVDHITPVSKGGKNEIMNLVTSCFDCNRGKGKKTLSDDSELEKQRAEIELRAERRKQIEMIKQWRDELRSEIDEETNYIAEMFKKDGGYELSEYGKSKIRKVLHQFGFQIVLEAAEIASFQYIKYGDRNSISRALDKLGGISYNLKNGKGW